MFNANFSSNKDCVQQQRTANFLSTVLGVLEHI